MFNGRSKMPIGLYFHFFQITILRAESTAAESQCEPFSIEFVRQGFNQEQSSLKEVKLTIDQTSIESWSMADVYLNVSGKFIGFAITEFQNHKLFPAIKLSFTTEIADKISAIIGRRSKQTPLNFELESFVTDPSYEVALVEVPSNVPTINFDEFVSIKLEGVVGKVSHLEYQFFENPVASYYSDAGYTGNDMLISLRNFDNGSMKRLQKSLTCHLSKKNGNHRAE